MLQLEYNLKTLINIQEHNSSSQKIIKEATTEYYQHLHEYARFISNGETGRTQPTQVDHLPCSPQYCCVLQHPQLLPQLLSALMVLTRDTYKGDTNFAHLLPFPFASVIHAGSFLMGSFNAGHSQPINSPPSHYYTSKVI